MNRVLLRRIGLIRLDRGVRLAVLAVLAAILCPAPLSAQEERGAGEGGLSELAVWRGQAFGTGRADFSAGFEKGLESLGAALTGALTPKLEDRLELAPEFRRDVGSYSVAIGYRETAISITASAARSGAKIEVTGMGAGWRGTDGRHDRKRCRPSSWGRSSAG